MADIAMPAPGFNNKRLRAGSITGRLRTASDLEESGYINKTEKGALKDLIISGDTMLQEALDKYERGDQSELAVICKSLVGRRHSIDLLENLDLDFNMLSNEGINYNSSTSNGDLGQEAMLGRLSDLNASDMLVTDAILAEVTTRDRRSSTIGSVDGISSIFRNSNAFDELAGLSSFNVGQQNNYDGGGGGQTLMASSFPTPSSAGISNAALARSGTMTTRRVTKSTIDPNIFETHVDANAYALHAQELMGSGTRSGGRSAYGSRSSTGISKRTVQGEMFGTMGASRTFEQMFGAAGAGIAWGRGVGPDGKFIGAEKGYVGAYSPEQRKKRIERFLEKRARRVWTKKVKYDVRKNFADSRLRVKGRFVKKEDEENMMRDLVGNAGP